MSVHRAGITSSTEERALTLLGSGLTPEVVANACGVSVSRITQLMSDDNFALEVATIRFQNLQKHNLRDDSYDSLEDKLITKLEDLLPLMVRPMEVLRAIQVVNSAKRRGSSAPETVINQQTVLNLTMPTKIINKFVTNINNQVVKVGEQDLITMQSGTLLSEIKTAAGSMENLPTAGSLPPKVLIESIPQELEKPKDELQNALAKLRTKTKTRNF